MAAGAVTGSARPAGALSTALTPRWRRAVTAALTGVTLGCAAQSGIVTLLVVGSQSMAPTHCRGAVVVVLRPGADSARPGDVVTFAGEVAGEPGTRWVKRVVASDGQRVAVTDGVLSVDGVPVPEPWLDRRTVDGTHFGPVLVPPGTVFVVGDARELSRDSRAFGAVPRSALTGRVLADWGGSCGRS